MRHKTNCVDLDFLRPIFSVKLIKILKILNMEILWVNTELEATVWKLKLADTKHTCKEKNMSTVQR